MAKADIRAGRAYIELLLKDGKYIKGLRNASQRLKNFGSSMSMIGAGITAAGGAILAPLAGAVNQFMSVGDALDKMRQRTGMSVESLSELSHAASQSDATLDDVGKAAGRMQRNLTDAARGSRTMRDAFSRLGLSVESLEAMSPDQQFDAVAKAIARVEDPTKRASAAMEVFGRGGVKLLPMIEDLDALKNEAREMGLTMGGESAARAVKLSDAIANVWKTVKEANIAIGDALAPTLLDLVGTIQEYVSIATSWVKQNKELFVTAMKVGAAVVAIGSAVTAVGMSFAAAGMALGGFATVIAAVGTAIGSVVSAIAAIGPVTWVVIAAIAGAVAAFVKYTTTGQKAAKSVLASFSQMWSEVVAGFGWLREVATTTWGGIVDAIAAGDLALAGEIAMAGLMVVWATGIASLNKVWQDWKAFILTVGNEASSDLAGYFVKAWHGIKSVWLEAKDFFLDLFDVISTGASNAFRSAQEFLGKGILNALESVGILSEEEAGWAREDLAAQTSGKSQQESAARDNRIMERERARKEAQAQIEAERNIGLESIEQGRNARNAEIEDNKNTSIGAANAAAGSAAEKLAELRATAAEKAEVARAARESITPVTTPEIPDVEARSKTVSGSFSAAALMASAGGGNAADRTAKATEAVAKESIVQSKRLEKIEKALERGGLIIA